MKSVLVVNQEFNFLREIASGRPLGTRHKSRCILARAVEMLVPGIERNGKQRARLPFESNALAGVVPDRGRTAAFEYIDHFLKQLSLRRQTFAWRNLADVAIVRGA